MFFFYYLSYAIKTYLLHQNLVQYHKTEEREKEKEKING